MPIKLNGLAASSTWGISTRKGNPRCIFTRFLSCPLCFEHLLPVFAAFPSGVRGVCYACTGEILKRELETGAFARAIEGKHANSMPSAIDRVRERAACSTHTFTR